MNGSTKILTVSYGTFSCTLEGFDDPLGSMREIAEYFRDLAADDRYFGAEPPTPDVEMLQNIAQKEVQRRVEARVSETGIALVATEETPEEPTETTVAKVVDRVAEDKTPDDDDTKGPLTFDDEFLMSDEPEDVLAVDPDARPDTDGPAESVAEKLRRIRAVVSKSIEGESSSDFSKSEAQTAAETAKRDRALTETIEQITADLSDDEETPGYDSADEIEDAIDLHPPVDEAADDVIEEIELESVQVETEYRVETEYVEPAGEHVEEPETEIEIEDEVEASGDVVDDEVTAEAFDDEDVEDDDQKLARTVSDVLGKISAASAEEDAPTKPERVKSRQPDIDIGRLLDETDTKLNEDETVRRRRVISQMRAAVAATKADRLVSRQVSREVEEEAEKDAYRDDLSEVVQDTPAAEPTRKPSSAPPLMLVSSQRIDAPSGEKPAVREIEQSDAPEGFAAFAESVGAKELHELLEAAAAYTVFAEGQSSFTRPEIMKRVARIDPNVRLSREDSLRSFGQLLRQGKFKKLERGQFTIDEATKFHPEHRFAGE